MNHSTPCVYHNQGEDKHITTSESEHAHTGYFTTREQHVHQLFVTTQVKVLSVTAYTVVCTSYLIMFQNHYTSWYSKGYSEPLKQAYKTWHITEQTF